MISTNDTLTNGRGVTVWLTGLSGSGKSNIADALSLQLKRNGCKVERLDGDVIRSNLWKELGFTKEDRYENIRRVTFLSKILVKNGIINIASFISPYRELREYARKNIGAFVEVYVKCPIEVCMQRDPKGLYSKALANEIRNFTGVSDPYEEPMNPDILIESNKEAIDNSVARIILYLEKLGYIKTDQRAMRTYMTS